MAAYRRQVAEFKLKVTLLDYTLSTKIDAIDWLELAGVFERAPLGTRDPAKLEMAFSNSQYVCFVHSGEILIGAGRALSDRASRAVIFDVVLLPEFQGQGIGTAIMRSLIDQALPEVVNIILYAVPGKEGFYKKLGFRSMKTAMGLFKYEDWQFENGYIE